MDVNQIPKTDCKTYYFMDESKADKIDWFLTKHGVMDYEIIRHSDMPHFLPAGMEIPLVLEDITDVPLVKATAVLISHMEILQLEQAIKEFRLGPEYTEAVMALSKKHSKDIPFMD